MFRYSIVLLCAVLVLSNVEFIQAGKYGGGGSKHSYPRSGGLSGGGHHSYPSSSGHSGGSHSYPSSGGLSGNGGRGGYPAGGGSHSYPNSPNSGGHNYPASGGNSGSHGYPASTGLSGSNTHGYPGGRGSPSGGTTNVHHHYHYSPPQQIQYASPHGGPAMNYPVYRGAPPNYVYQYKDSGSKYGTLLAGLALLNLGALAGGAVGYGIGHSSSGGSSHSTYKTQPGEVCIFGIKKDNGDFEETKIDCQLISSFILQEQAKQNSQNQTVVSVTQTNVTTVVNTPNAPDAPTYIRLENGTLIPAAIVTNQTNTANTTSEGALGAGTVTSSSTTTITNTTVVNAVDVKGKPVEVTPGMQCYVKRRTPTSQMKKEVPCGLLQTYADKSLKPNSATRNLSAFTTLAFMCAVFIVY